MSAIYGLYSEFSFSLLPIVLVICILVLGATTVLIIIDDCPHPGLPVVGQGKYEFGSLIARYRFFVSAKDIIAEGLRNVS
jgi:hypothetical protein